MDEPTLQCCTAFAGNRRVASEKLTEVAAKVKEIIDHGEQESINIFNDVTGEIIEIDFRGTIEDVLQRLEKSTVADEALSTTLIADHNTQRGPGRPKLGVVAREVTLLPRHWQWLSSQPGGASVALRKLVEEARRVNADRDKVRCAQEATYRFMHAMTGDMPGFEEATRALFAGDPQRFNDHINSWPADIKDYVHKLTAAVFQ